MIVGAFYRRALGGGFPIRRSILNVSYSLWGFALGTALSQDWVLGLVTSFVLVGGHTGPLHGESMDRGHAGGSWVGDALLMTGRFALWGLPLAYFLDAWIWWPVWAATTSAAYDIAYGLFHIGLSEAPTEDAEWMQGGLWETGAIVLLLS